MTARRLERNLSMTREHPGSANSRMPRHRNFARWCENPHPAHRARQIGSGNKSRFAEIQLTRERLHLGVADPGRIAEHRKLVAPKWARSEDIDQCKFRLMCHREN